MFFSSAKWFEKEFRAFLSSTERFVKSLGTKVKAFLSSADWLGTKFRAFSVPQNRRNSDRMNQHFPCSMFRRIIFSRKIATLQKHCNLSMEELAEEHSKRSSLNTNSKNKVTFCWPSHKNMTKIIDCLCHGQYQTQRPTDISPKKMRKRESWDWQWRKEPSGTFKNCPLVYSLSQWEGSISTDLALGGWWRRGGGGEEPTGIFKDSPLVYSLSQWEGAISADLVLGGWWRKGVEGLMGIFKDSPLVYSLSQWEGPCISWSCFRWLVKQGRRRTNGNI